MSFITQIKNKYILIIIIVAVLIIFASNGISYWKRETERNRLTGQINIIQSEVDNYGKENESLKLENENLKLENEMIKAENEDLKEKIGESLSPDQITDKVISYINQNLLPKDTTASLINILEESGLYKIKLKIEGEEYDSYVTKDGKMLFPSGIGLELK